MPVIDAVDRELEAWVQGVVGALPVALTLPDASASDAASGPSGVRCYLLELAERAPLRQLQPSPLQFDLRYLVTTWAATAPEAHRLLGELVMAAMDAPDILVDLRPLEPNTWRALGMVPQPSCILQLPVRKPRTAPLRPVVTEPLSIRSVAAGPLHGVVLGPGGRPLARAVVEIPGLQLATRTDGAGRFHFSTVPAAEHVTSLTVRAKGHLTRVAVPERSWPMEPLTIHVDLPQVHREER
jgi:hypothetical protein